MAQQDGPTSPRKHRGPDEHRTTTVEKGPFCTARCTCGWRGPARRARSAARADAEGHVGG
ncbi:hypothetical protein EJ357_21455 [Streptomyces cyaneochromogenes]|uniref:Mobile element transfer n=1 Tax=Streptomyces cyaneochromogenes TaxID=2496836 RepID=A0A3Q9ENF6_9ACTN|nr:hypothetical protein [Streptomyces cyaneochromogenes]AZQ35749.1 hypothetical protein EJ357_21455 [Streptomyces cyaneochromogenes]